MDQPMDIDNLFAEDNLNRANLEAGLLADNDQILQNVDFSPSAHVVQRVADLSFCGALAKIAWSRQGHIARITNDGTSVEIQIQRIDTKASKWTLSLTRPLDVVFEDAVNLAWNSPGTDLAVTDRKGRVYWFHCSSFGSIVSHDQLALLRDGTLEDYGSMSPCVGLFWLQHVKSDRSPKQVVESTKRDEKWHQLMVESQVFYPCNFKAMCAVDASGLFSVLFQRGDSQIRKASQLLPIPSQSVLTHSTITATPDKRLLVAVHDHEGRTSTFHVRLDFGQDLRQNPQSEVLPTIQIDTIGLTLPFDAPYFNNTSGLSQDVPEKRLLTHLEFVSTSELNWEHASGSLTKPPPTQQPTTLLAVYTSYDMSGSLTSNLQDSIIKRWHLRTAEVTLHPRFNQGSSTAVGEAIDIVDMLPDIHVPFAILHLQLLEPGNTIVIFSFAGQASFYDAHTFQPIPFEQDLGTVESVANIGLNMTTSSSVSTCSSTHVIASAEINDNDELKIVYPSYVNGADVPANLNFSNGSDEALAALYLLLFARTILSNSTYDDILTSISHNISPSSFSDVLRQLYITHSKPADFLTERHGKASELEKVIHKHHLSKIVSFHFALIGPKPAQVTREHKLVYLSLWTAMNLRWSFMNLLVFFQQAGPPRNLQNQAAQQPPPAPPNYPPSYINMLEGNIKWLFSFFAFVFQHILTIGDRKTNPELFQPPTFDSTLGDEQADGTQGLIALILNSAWTRAYLVQITRLLNAFEKAGGLSADLNNPATSNIHANIVSGPLTRISQTVLRCVHKYGLTIKAMGLLVDAKWCTDNPKEGQAPIDGDEVMKRQIEMMISGVVPPPYQDTIHRLLTECINGADGLRAKGEMDRLRILQNCPEISTVLLNMDDIAFERHTPSTRPFDAHDTLDDLTSNSNTSTTREKRQLFNVYTKLPLFSHTTSNPSGPMTTSPATLDQLLDTQVRRCNHCGSLCSDVPVSERPELERAYRSWPRQALSFIGRCVCDGVWLSERLGDGIH